VSEFEIHYRRLADSNSAVNGSTPGGDVFGWLDKDGTRYQHLSSNLTYLAADLKHKADIPEDTKIIFVED
jgi:hypothetical protein